MMASTPTKLHICVTCRQGQSGASDPCAGESLYREVALRAGVFPGTIEVYPATCLANCERGCSAAIAAEGKWSYLLGRLSPELASDLLVYAMAYAKSSTGSVMASKRPESLSQIITGRIPPSSLPQVLS